MPNPTPKTIEELSAWYIAHRLPPEEVTRFFIGKDIREPRAFGIYRDGDYFVVYKNKSDGSRATRYHGPDEAYAVNELYEKLKQEIASQKFRNTEERAIEEKKNRKYSAISIGIAVLLGIAIVLFSFWLVSNEPDRGYYRDLDTWYYYQDGSWYTYYDDDWHWCDQTPEISNDYRDYYISDTFESAYGLSDFELTDYYSSTDTDSTWSSSDSWDSGSTDWSSDW